MSAKASFALRCYLVLSRIAEPLYRAGLTLRLKRGKEDPARYREKLGIIEYSKPAGTIIWMHGVGLGEVLALRSLIRSLSQHDLPLNFLVTSSTRTSAKVFAKHCPANTIHQFLPIDTTVPIKKFLDHWQPSISVWAEQDLWPALVYYTDKRNIPLALVNARMNRKSYQSRARIAALYRDLYRRFAWISAQDQNTAIYMNRLGADATVGGSLKAAAIPLTDKPAERAELERDIGKRPVWLLATSHPEDELLAIETHKQLIEKSPDALLIIAPRLIDRSDNIKAHCTSAGLTVSTRSKHQSIGESQIYIADTFGEMGIWYRLSRCAFIGGSNSAVQGHNPWEAASLNCAIAYGPKTQNFHNDYRSLAEHEAAIKIENSEQLTGLLTDESQQLRLANNAYALAQSNNRNIDNLAGKLLTLLDKPGEP